MRPGAGCYLQFDYAERRNLSAWKLLCYIQKLERLQHIQP